MDVPQILLALLTRMTVLLSCDNMSMSHTCTGVELRQSAARSVQEKSQMLCSTRSNQMKTVACRRLSL